MHRLIVEMDGLPASPDSKHHLKTPQPRVRTYFTQITLVVRSFQAPLDERVTRGVDRIVDSRPS